MLSLLNYGKNLQLCLTLLKCISYTRRQLYINATVGYTIYLNMLKSELLLVPNKD